MLAINLDDRELRFPTIGKEGVKFLGVPRLPFFADEPEVENRPFTQAELFKPEHRGGEYTLNRKSPGCIRDCSDRCFVGPLKRYLREPAIRLVQSHTTESRRRDVFTDQTGLPEGRRGAAFGLRQSLDTLGAFIGPLLAIVLMWAFANDFQSVFWVAVIPAFMALGLILFAVKEPARPEGLRKVRNPLSRAELRLLGGMYWAVVAVATVFTLARFSEAFLILRAEEVGMPLMLVPLVLVGMNAIYALSAWPAGVLSDRMSRPALLMAGLALLIAADLVLALAPGLAGLGLGIALWGLHMGLTQGLLSALVAEAVPPELRGTAYGMFNLITGGALLLASVIAGGLWQGLGSEATFLAGAAFALIAALGLIPLRHRLA